MKGLIQFTIGEIIPDKVSVLKAQGIVEGQPVPERINSLVEKALDLTSASAKPLGMVSEVTREEFKPIFIGEGKNEPDTPVGHVFRWADRLALFALTLGSVISNEIEILFKKNDFALGAMLDAAASLAADRAVSVMEQRFLDDVVKDERLRREAATWSVPHATPRTVAKAGSSDIYVLSYSPGYCGWHISGQKKLFRYLKPEKIGIMLTESFLMVPLKSVTGVLIAGPRKIHLFEANYPFCRFCKDRSCLERRKRILGN